MSYRRQKGAEELIAALGLKPLPGEGGYYRETHRGVGTAIYYLVTPHSFSTLHRLWKDEVFHFYRGDTVEQCLIYPDGHAETRLMGADIESGQSPQSIVPAGVWQGSRLLEGGEYALMGTTVAPAFEFSDLELGGRQALCEKFPAHRALIARFTRESPL